MRSKIFILLISLAVIGGCKSDNEDTPDEVIKNPFLIEEGQPSLIVAHRGGRNLAPENTLVAFDNAVQLDVDVLEMDVVLTKDSQLVTIHDRTIDRTCDTSGNVSDYTFEELQAFNFGYNFKDDQGNYPYQNNPVLIPKIQDVLSRYSDELLMIEIKDPGNRGILAADILLPLIAERNLEKHTVVFSFDYLVTDYVNSINDIGVYTGASAGDVVTLTQAVQATNDSTLAVVGEVFALPDSPALIEEEVISTAHKYEKAVHYWTVNDKYDMKTLIQKGTDGIITDNPDVMIEALTELGF